MLTNHFSVSVYPHERMGQTLNCKNKIIKTYNEPIQRTAKDAAADFYVIGKNKCLE